MKRRHLIAAASLMALSAGSAFAQSDVKVALITPLSGAWARSGDLARKGAELAIDDINKAWGIKALGGAKMKLVVADTGATPETAKTAAQRLLANEPDLVGGSGSEISSFTLAVTEVTERADLPWLTLTYSDLITGRGFKNIFQTSPTADEIGVLTGVVAAGGLELALCCDLLLAGHSTQIADAHIRHGLIPGAGGTTILPRRIGLARAKQMLFTGAFETAATLQNWGLINWVVADNEVHSAANDLVTRLAAMSPDALCAMKALSNAAIPDDLLAHEGATMRRHLGTSAAAEGLAAFREKRRPRFE